MISGQEIYGSFDGDQQPVRYCYIRFGTQHMNTYNPRNNKRLRIFGMHRVVAHSVVAELFY